MKKTEFENELWQLRRAEEERLTKALDAFKGQKITEQLKAQVRHEVNNHLQRCHYLGLLAEPNQPVHIVWNRGQLHVAIGEAQVALLKMDEVKWLKGGA
jgi:hypothetical protein